MVKLNKTKQERRVLDIINDRQFAIEQSNQNCAQKYHILLILKHDTITPLYQCFKTSATTLYQNVRVLWVLVKNKKNTTHTHTHKINK